MIDFKSFLSNHLVRIIPLTKASNIADYKSLVTGEEEYYEESKNLELEYRKIYSNKDEFNQIKGWMESGVVKEPYLKRELELLYNYYLSNQADFNKLKSIVELETNINKRFNTYRANLNGELVTDNFIDVVLKNSNDSSELMNAYLASKAVGEVVRDDVIKVIKLRNEVASDLGFTNYYDMRLKLSEMEPSQIDSLFKELDSLTSESFFKAKAELDDALSKRYNISVNELMPWHYHNRFFQEAPGVFSVDFDKFFKDKDIVSISSKYFDSIGLPVNDIIINSDLFERAGKYQHACAYDIDSEGDVRIICNIVPTQRWCDTALHELGHAINFKYYDYSKPWMLRKYNSQIITEAVAMFFGAKSKSPEWLSSNGVISDADKELISESCFKSERLERLIFARWSLVMYDFERALYSNPEQDLNHLWWSLVSKYQGLKQPLNRDKPDWAAKIHLASTPCYYHNYIMGELFSAQLDNFIKSNVKPGGLSEFLVNDVFSHGRCYPWNEVIKLSTGQHLTPKYFAEKYV